MPRPQKGNLKPNQAYLKDWDEYQNDRPGSTPILLPVSVDINADGELTRNRMKAGDVEALFARCRNELPKHLSNAEINPHDAASIFNDYVEYFKEIDAAQGPVPTPLDIRAKRPVWALFHLPRENWKFTEGCQYSTLNDRDDILRNFEKLCTFDDENYLLLSNRYRSSPSGLKFNLHITISQTSKNGNLQKTPIIIDPEWDNDRD